MSQTINTHTTRAEIKGLTLFDTLYNDLILRHTLPYLPVSGILNLAATCKDIRYLLHETPGVFRHLDLTRVKTAHVEDVKQERNLAVWHNVELEDYLTEDDFYAGPLRGIFSTLRHRNILHNVQSLILDGLSVTAELCHDIINNPDYNVRMLSIRGAKNLNQAKLRAALAYACRPTRPSNLRLKALYIFSETTDDDAYWHNKGRVMESTSGMDDWAQCLLACQGIISFDAVLCQGPRHVNSPAFGNPPFTSPTALTPADPIVISTSSYNATTKPHIIRSTLRRLLER
ncbi:uncharacterized protein FIESC28_05561 [Fusarium coffeatum]|uniref:F-box domain-containing protein n=1 Tax=Fusarium coffeatum TaxID=231269 RepID=A0A366RSZ3_9HYPO|nr:uncharacterized protein FIESC28_05561 [Fusarium coffeatum]RBR19566.1 hypothetical protein FIESC28_05561 [Fusarium coffeatum]